MIKKLTIIFLICFAWLTANAENADALYYYGNNGPVYASGLTSNGEVINFSSADDQSFQYGDSATTISTISIEQQIGSVGAGINTTDDIRITIPSTVDMIWDATDTTTTIGGSASAKVSTTVSYEDINKTLVINVTSDFSDGDTITVSDLAFTNFNASSLKNQHLILEIDNSDTTIALDLSTIEISCPASSAIFTGNSGPVYASGLASNGEVFKLSSAIDQSFQSGDSATTISTISLEQQIGSVGAGINTTDDIRITIPSNVNMTWDATDTTATIGGIASAKVSATISYEDSNKTLVINVTSNFTDNDLITVDDLSFTAFNAASYQIATSPLRSTTAAPPSPQTQATSQSACRPQP